MTKRQGQPVGESPRRLITRSARATVGSCARHTLTARKSAAPWVKWRGRALGWVGNYGFQRSLTVGAGLGRRKAQRQNQTPSGRPGAWRQGFGLFATVAKVGRVGKSQAVAVSFCSAGVSSNLTPRMKSAAFCACADAWTISFLSFCSASSQF